MRGFTAAVWAMLAAAPALAADACGRGELTGGFSGDTLSLRWEGHVNDQMAPDIAAAFDKRKTFAKAVTLSLNSCGGDLRDMQRAIVVIETIRSRASLTTEVRRGDKCASACVPIFLAGKRRIGALASLFYFHPVVVRRGDPGTTAEVARAQYRSQLTDEIIQRYFIPAGVSDDWLQYLRQTLRTRDLWQSGRDLWDSKSGILTETLDNLEPRDDGPIDMPTGAVCGTLCRG